MYYSYLLSTFSVAQIFQIFKHSIRYRTEYIESWIGTTDNNFLNCRLQKEVRGTVVSTRLLAVPLRMLYCKLLYFCLLSSISICFVCLCVCPVFRTMCHVAWFKCCNSLMSNYSHRDVSLLFQTSFIGFIYTARKHTKTKSQLAEP